MNWISGFHQDYSRPPNSTNISIYKLLIKDVLMQTLKVEPVILWINQLFINWIKLYLQ